MLSKVPVWPKIRTIQGPVFYLDEKKNFGTLNVNHIPGFGFLRFESSVEFLLLAIRKPIEPQLSKRKKGKILVFHLVYHYPSSIFSVTLVLNVQNE